MKSSLRTELRAKLKAIPPEMRAEAALRALALLEKSGLITSKAILAGYMPTAYEFDVRPMLGWHSACALPVIAEENQPLVFRAYKAGDALQPNRYGIAEPLETAPLCTPDILLVPLLGFDKTGGRLGQGGGFYDRTLAKYPAALKIGVGFAAQECPEIPREPHDIVMDAILTEKEVIRVPA